MAKEELVRQVENNIVDTVEQIYDSMLPPDVLIRPLKPDLELEEESTTMSKMEKSARFQVRTAEELATIKAQVVADVVDITETILAEAEAIVKEVVTEPAQQHQILSYIEKRLAKEGIWAQFDKPELKVEAAEEKTTEAQTEGLSLRERIQSLIG